MLPESKMKRTKIEELKYIFLKIIIADDFLKFGKRHKKQIKKWVNPKQGKSKKTTTKPSESNFWMQKTT